MCCIAQTTQSSDVRDQDGRTELMNYVREQELEIEIRKIDLDKLWNTYFYKEKIVSGYSTDAQGNTSSSYKYIPLRKIYTTDADIAQYRKIEDEYNLFIDDIIENIKIMVLNGADLQAYDQHGKNIINYCFTKEIHDTLQYLGAPFSLQAWIYFNPSEALVNGFFGGSAALMITAGIVIICINANR